MTTLADRTAADGARLRPVLAALVHLLALGTAVGTFAGIGRWRPDVWEHDRFGYALVAGLAVGALLSALAALTVPRPLRLPYLAWVGIGLLPSFAAAGLVELPLSIFVDLVAALTSYDLRPYELFDPRAFLGASAILIVGTVAGALAGADPVTRRFALPVGKATLGTLAAAGALVLWVAAGLYQ